MIIALLYQDCLGTQSTTTLSQYRHHYYSRKHVSNKLNLCFTERQPGSVSEHLKISSVYKKSHKINLDFNNRNLTDFLTNKRLPGN